jgi:hypothetical protein
MELLKKRLVAVIIVKWAAGSSTGSQLASPISTTRACLSLGLQANHCRATDVAVPADVNFSLCRIRF